VRIRLLGEVGVVTDQRRPADIGPAKCRAVLAALALSAGTAVPQWRLAELVWGDDPPRTAARTLQSYVVRLRKGLGRDAIVRVGAAYRLDVPADSVDVLVQAGRLQDAALMLGHLDKTAPYWAPQVAEARSTIAAARIAPDHEPGGLDNHQALEHMRRVLDQLAADRSQA